MNFPWITLIATFVLFAIVMFAIKVVGEVLEVGPKVMRIANAIAIIIVVLWLLSLLTGCRLR